MAEFIAAYYTAVEPSRQREALRNWSFAVHECADCGLLFQREVPDEEFLGELYGRWLGKNDPLAPTKPPMPLDYYAYMAQEIMQLIAFLQRRKGMSRRLRVLDYGMGWGNWAQMAQAFGAETYGLELAPNKVLHAKSLGIQVVSPEELRNHTFDFICTEQVVEHLADPRDTIVNLSGLLDSGGILKISVPDGNEMKATLRNWSWRDAILRKDDIMPLHPLEHLNCFTPQALRRFATICGLKPVRLPLRLVYSYSTDWSSARASAKNLLRPIKRFVQQKGCYALFERQ